MTLPTATKQTTSYGRSPLSSSVHTQEQAMTLESLPNGFHANQILSSGPKSTVVQKYGGTSVGKFASEIVSNVIKPSLLKDCHVAVVCSAISATVKVDGTTNRYAAGLQYVSIDLH